VTLDRLAGGGEDVRVGGHRCYISVTAMGRLVLRTSA
jgi:hypothetical protein